MDLGAAIETFRGPDGAIFIRLAPGDLPSPADRGSYALTILLEVPATLAIGRLGHVFLPAGCYVYCGSALGGLAGRIGRHLRSEKRRHWHVDYLLERGVLVGVWVARTPHRLECQLSTHLASLPDGCRAVAHFGSSDCRCRGHLVRWTGQSGFPGVPLI